MNDEQQIRQLVATWMSASKNGDTATVLSLMTDDALFMVTGQPLMSKADFATAMQAQSHHAAPQIDGISDIHEIQIMGDWAFIRTTLRIVATPPSGETVLRVGHTLSILHKQEGKWLLARDANMLARVQV